MKKVSLIITIVLTALVHGNQYATQKQYICCEGRVQPVDLIARCRGCCRQLCQRCEIVPSYALDRNTNPNKEYFFILRHCPKCNTKKTQRWFFMGKDKSNRQILEEDDQVSEEDTSSWCAIQ